MPDLIRGFIILQKDGLPGQARRQRMQTVPASAPLVSSLNFGDQCEIETGPLT
jgi:hypothetical protein